MSGTIMALKSDVEDILLRALQGEPLGYDDCIRLMRSRDVNAMGKVANILKERLHGRRVSFINNLILNYTNICITYCKFCAFYRPPRHSEGYTVSVEECIRRVGTAKALFNIRQVLMQGGHNPDLGIEYYESVFRAIKARFPDVAVHALSPSEIDMIARVERSSTREVLARLKDAGLDSIPGGGAEILDDEVKSVISPLKIRSDEWLRIMEEAHMLGIPSSATMMYGHVESIEQRARSLMRIMELQKRSGGFMAFIPWNFEPNNTEMQREGLVRYPSGGMELLKMISVSRIMLNGLIDHVQSSWLTNGVGMAQLALHYGADDFGGTLHGEEVVSATGARATTLTEERIVSAIRQVGMRAVERDNMYNIIRYFD
ncbi:MAG: cyclic dehypoxanthinyl futalosine synthase [Candidatus Nitrosocaldus sp.]|nr:dehypoxanthine futalosine cyclase [Candidatus Nitrosocaldus sp.]MDW8276090.1 cyclic dehypoxanthinyl futalosine synthase [Candidatus Nitrosocaldus sp.]